MRPPKGQIQVHLQTEGIQVTKAAKSCQTKEKVMTMDCKVVGHVPEETRMISGMGRRGDPMFWEQRANSIKTSGLSKENQKRKNILPATLPIRCTCLFFFFFFLTL